MQLRAWVAMLAPGCGFHGASLQPTDAPAPNFDAAAVDAAGADAAPATCGGKVWLADFASDPTTLDGNGDGVADWAIRDGTPFAVGDLSGGVWHVPSAGKPLDSQPRQPFTTRTLVHVRMRAAAPTTGHGAVFWINVGYRTTDDTFAPLYVSADLIGTAQQVSVWTKVAGVETQLPAADSVPAAAFADVTFDIDPTTLHVLVDGAQPVQLVRQPSGPSSHDAWATVVAYGVAADFDLIRVEVCP